MWNYYLRCPNNRGLAPLNIFLHTLKMFVARVLVASIAISLTNCQVPSRPQTRLTMNKSTIMACSEKYQGRRVNSGSTHHIETPITICSGLTNPAITAG